MLHHLVIHQLLWSLLLLLLPLSLGYSRTFERDCLDSDISFLPFCIFWLPSFHLLVFLSLVLLYMHHKLTIQIVFFCACNICGLTTHRIIKSDCLCSSTQTSDSHFSWCWSITGDDSCIYWKTSLSHHSAGPHLGLLAAISTYLQQMLYLFDVAHSL